MNDKIQNAILGALVADAIAMPAHWYYNTEALDRDYPDLSHYVVPKNPHPDSILWRSSYTPLNRKANILHDQAQYWGQKEIHYHQFLPAGDNTLNFLLALQLYRSTIATGHYDPNTWLERYVELMQKPGWHADTYVEEYHRAFFENVARGTKPEHCGVKDIHIGGLTPVPFLLAALDALGDRDVDEDVTVTTAHLSLTHKGKEIREAGEAFTRILHALAAGQPVREAIGANAKDWATESDFEKWSQLPNREVVGRVLTPACYLPESFTAALYFCWKYHEDFEAGVIANARCGGDNCHRGVVVGSILACANEIPEKWLQDLKSIERMRCDTLEPTFN